MSKFFVSKNSTPMDLLSDTDALINLRPDYYNPRFEAIADLRAQDDGSLHRGQEFRRVASLVNVPLALAVKMENREFLRDKKAFWKWLSGPGARYKTFDSKGGSRTRMTYTDGKGHAW